MPPKISLFIWKLKHKILPTRDLLSTRIPGIINECIFYTTEGKNIDHLFFSCPFTKNYWQKIMKWWDMEDARIYNGELWGSLYQLSRSSDQKSLSIISKYGTLVDLAPKK